MDAIIALCNDTRYTDLEHRISTVHFAALILRAVSKIKRLKKVTRDVNSDPRKKVVGSKKSCESRKIVASRH